MHLFIYFTKDSTISGNVFDQLVKLTNKSRLQLSHSVAMTYV